MRHPNETSTWEYWIPGWSQALFVRDLVSGNLGDGISKTFGINSGVSTNALGSQASDLLGEVRQEYLADREHTEAREDSAYQRGVVDMRKAGLNPYTIGASPSPSSASSVGSNVVGSKLQILGYLLDLKNLDSKNRKITNDAIGNVLSLFKK